MGTRRDAWGLHGSFGQEAPRDATDMPVDAAQARAAAGHIAPVAAGVLAFQRRNAHLASATTGRRARLEGLSCVRSPHELRRRRVSRCAQIGSVAA